VKHKRKKSKRKIPKPYRSMFEYDFHQQYNQLLYEPLKFSYTVEREYTPDFVSPCGKYWYELKGFFRAGDSQKYKAIGRCMLVDEPELVFVFQDPKTKMCGAKRRKDGTVATVAEWCDRNGFEWCTKETFDKLKERMK